MNALSPKRLLAVSCLACLATSTACGEDGGGTTASGGGGGGGAATAGGEDASTSSTGGAGASSTGGAGGTAPGTGGEAAQGAGGASTGAGGGGGAGGNEPMSACEKYCAAAKEAMCPPGDDPGCVEDCHYEAQLAQEDGCDKQFEAWVLCKATNGDVCNPSACGPLESDYGNCTSENGAGGGADR